MLFILNATPSIGVKFIANELLRVFNSQIIDDHFVELNPIKITNKEGRVVYDNEVNENEIVRTNKTLFDKVVKLDTDLINLSREENYNVYSFDDFYYDYGITEHLNIDLWQNAPEFVDGVLTYHNNDVNYQKTLDKYINRSSYINSYVISGHFSRGIIERFQKDLGEENVVVINFLRNPSTAAALNLEDDDYYLQPSKAAKEFYNLKLFKSILTNISVMSVKGVINIKFEDFLKNGFITIKNKKINLPKIYKNFNSILTSWEKEKILKTKVCTVDKINYYNDVLSSCEKSIDEFLECTKFYIKEELINSYVEKINNSKNIEPICLHFYKDRYLMSDGLNRFLAYKKLNIKEIPVHDGTKLFTMSDQELDEILKNDDEYEYKDSDKGRILELLPANMFVSMEYQPLTLDELLKSPT